MTHVKILHGYTAQARYFAEHMETDAAGDWLTAGWIKLSEGVKPVFRLDDGCAVVIRDGGSHLDAVVIAVDQSAILATEEECWRTEP